MPINIFAAMQATNDAFNSYLHFDSGGTFAFNRAYIDTDQDPATGFRIPGSVIPAPPTSGLPRDFGANYMLEGATCYQHKVMQNDPNGWNWAQPGMPVVFELEKNHVSWAAFRSQVPITATIVFEVDDNDGLPANYSPRLVPKFSPLNIFRFSNDTAKVYYQFSYEQPTLPWQTYRVYIDADDNKTTGYPVPNRDMGANYMIENNKLYTRRPDNSDWQRATPVEVSFTNVNNTVAWTMMVGQLGGTVRAGGKAGLVFEVERPSGPTPRTEASKKFLQTYTSPTSQRIAVPAYFGPNRNPPLWSRIADGSPMVGLVVINPANGPFDHYDAPFDIITKHVQDLGIRVLGYVYTSYASRSLTEVQACVDEYYQQIPTIDGIFFDEVANQQQAHYQALSNYVKGKTTGARTVVLNPGTNVDQSYMNFCDILVNFEGTFDAYQNHVFDAWGTGYAPERFWHLIHTCLTDADQLKAVRLSRQSNRAAKWLYVTPAPDPPWGTLPWDKVHGYTPWLNLLSRAWE